MKSTLAALATTLTLTHAVTLPELFRRAGSCEAQNDVTTTFYGYPDNDPPSAQTAYDCLGRGNTAGGSGTYADPLTFATAPGEYDQCEIVYSAYLKKYLIFQDTCAQCTSDFSSGKKHIDIWTGSSTESGGDAQIDCENSLTPDSSNFLRNPPQGLDVSTAETFSDGQCNKDATFNGNTADCSGGSSAPASSSTSASSSAPAPTSTGSSGSCSWAGHCAGATCSSDDDCSDDLTCNSGKCGSS